MDITSAVAVDVVDWALETVCTGEFCRSVSGVVVVKLEGLGRAVKDAVPASSSCHLVIWETCGGSEFMV